MKNVVFNEFGVRAPGQYDPDLVSTLTGLDCSVDKGRTQQSFAADADINTLIERFGVGGPMPQGVRMPVFADFSQVDDFESAMSAVVDARESFDAMPAKVRARFHNDPQEFLEFCSDRDNLDEARKLGLVPAEEVKAEVPPVKVEVVPPVVAAPGAPGKAPGTV